MNAKTDDVARDRGALFWLGYAGFCGATLLLYALIVGVVPVLATVYSDFGGKLPGSTEHLFNFSKFANSFGIFKWALVVGALGGAFFLFDWLGTKRRPWMFMTIGLVCLAFLWTGWAAFLPMFTMRTLIAG